MSFVQREIDRIHAELLTTKDEREYDRLYAAQQALSWALDPTSFRSPYNAIKGIEESGPSVPPPPSI